MKIFGMGDFWYEDPEDKNLLYWWYSRMVFFFYIVPNDGSRAL